jgi:hypothetical protein
VLNLAAAAILNMSENWQDGQAANPMMEAPFPLDFFLKISSLLFHQLYMIFEIVEDTVVPAMSSRLIHGCTLQVAAHDRFISMINDKSVYK